VRVVGIRYWLLGIGVILAGLYFAPNAGAISSLKIQPLLYEDQLQKGEVKKGFIDVSNPTDESIKVTTSVEGFKQTDDDGSLEFFASEAIEKGITPDYKSFTLKPREALRMMFEIDGTKLPPGDVFAALFFTTKSGGEGTVRQAVRVGTLFILENGTPGTRKADITDVQTKFLHIGSFVDGSYTVKNTAKANEATGFTPRVEVSLTPFGSPQPYESSLVFAGRERTNQFTYNTELAGLYKLSARYDNSEESRWVLLLPLWSIVVLVSATILGLIVPLLLRTHHTGKKQKRDRKKYATLKRSKKKE